MEVCCVTVSLTVVYSSARILEFWEDKKVIIVSEKPVQIVAKLVILLLPLSRNDVERPESAKVNCHLFRASKPHTERM